VTRIALLVRLLHAAPRHDPFELRTLAHQENVPEGFDVRDAVRHTVDAVGSGDCLCLIDIAAVIPERQRSARVQKDAAGKDSKGCSIGLDRRIHDFRLGPRTQFSRHRNPLMSFRAIHGIIT
jgi:hypothetical protein